MMRTALSFLALGTLTLALLAGCSTSNDDGAQANDSAVTAKEANDAQGAFKQQVISGFAASEKNQTALGIKTWDVFVGGDATGAVGTVFYASDADGQVRYMFSADTASKKISVSVLEKDGTASANQEIDQANLAALGEDLVRLRDTVKASQSAKGNVKAQDYSLPDTRTFTCAVTVFYGVVGVIAVGGLWLGGAAIATGGLVGVLVGAVPLAGGAYAAYEFVTAIPEGLAEDATICVTGKTPF